MKGRLLRKVASVSVVASMVMLTAGPVMGQTIEELLAQIQALQAQLLALQALQGGAQAYTFTRDLYMGVSGDDVRALQNYLKAGGYFTVNPTGYFGPITKAAVAAWQAANGVSPAAGYFGPLSRAKYNQLVAVVPSPTVSPSPAPSPEPGLEGEEGSFRNVAQLSDVSGAILREGQDDRKVIGMEFEASGSDLRVERVDVLFAWSSGSGSSNRPWRYFDEVALYNGDELLVSKPAGSSGNWSDEGTISGFGNAKAYKMSFTGVGEIVRKGDKMNLYVAVSTKDTIDTADANAVWAVRLAQNSIRAVDAAGISQYAPSANLDDTFSFATATTGTLAISSSAALNKSRVVRVHDTNDTNDVEILNFDMKATTKDVKVTSITVTATEGFTGATNAFADGVRRFKLYRNGALVKTVSAPSTGNTFTFSDLNIVVPADTTDSFVVKADMRDTESGRFENSNTLAVTAVSATAEDPAKGTTITPTGNVVGGEIAFFDKGISVTLLEKSAQRFAGQGTNGTYDTANYTIKFRVSAFGANAYVMKDAFAVDSYQNPPQSYGAGYDVIATANDAAIQSLATAVLTPSTGDDGNGNHIVRDGTTRDFTLTVSARGTVSNAFARVGLEAIHWSLDNQSTSTLVYTYGLDSDWQTPDIELRVY